MLRRSLWLALTAAALMPSPALAQEKRFIITEMPRQDRVMIGLSGPAKRCLSAGELDCDALSELESSRIGYGVLTKEYIVVGKKGSVVRWHSFRLRPEHLQPPHRPVELGGERWRTIAD